MKMADNKRFIFLEHTADIKFQAFGKTLNEAFENAALAMFSAMYDGNVKTTIKKRISVEGKDFESLLYNFLEELLFLLDSENFFLGKIKVSLDEKNFKLEAEAKGDLAGKYPASIDVKAVTYNEMFIKKEKTKKGDRFICQVVVDV